jgi:pyruvate kinase
MSCVRRAPQERQQTPCRLCLVWGIHAVRIREADRVSEIVEHACETVRDEGLAGPGDIIAIAAGMPFGVAGAKKPLRIERLATA